MWTVHEGAVEQTVVDPRDVGLPRATAADLRGGDAHDNAAVVRRVLDGEPGPARDAVVLNAGAALAVHDDPAAVPEALAAGVTRAAEAIDSGAGRAALDRWVAAASA